MTKHAQSRRSGRGGYTLIEVTMASAISLMVLGASIGLFLGVQRSWSETNLRVGVDSDVNLALSRMVYGMGASLGLRCASQATCTAQGSDWTLAYRTGGDTAQNNSFVYSAADRTLVFNPGGQTICRDLTFARVYVQGGGLVVTLRVERVEGRFSARRELGTEIAFRNL
jgi:type II secretory pathway pseudopilin PulG